MARILLNGYMVRLPFAGNVLAYAQYIKGFELLGHQVLYLETSGWPNACYDPQTEQFGDDPTPGIRAVEKMLHSIGVRSQVVFLDQTDTCHGMDWPDVKESITCADVLLNVGGVCWLPEFEACSCRALIDMDPFFTQVGKFAGEGFDRYHAHFTYGTNIGRPGCLVPTSGIDWTPIVPPVVPQLWWDDRDKDHVAANPPRFTTIANWSAYGSIEYGGAHYGQKNDSFAELLELPAHIGAQLEIAASGMPDADVLRFERHGWLIGSGAEASREWLTYRRFITNSDGELSAAKHGYVISRSGWISDRTVCYLAAGRPAIVQDTAIPPGVINGADGFVVFSNLEEAARAIHDVTAGYARHSHAATGLAESTFSYRVTLPHLLDLALASHATPSPPAQSRPTKP